MRTEGSFRQTAKRQLDDSIHAGRSLAARHAGVLPAYERLLRHVQTRTTLLQPSDRAGDNRNAFNSGLLALALYHGDWLRPVESWHPVRQNAWPQFSRSRPTSARPVSRSTVYDLGLVRPAARRKTATARLVQAPGPGENIRTAKLPLRLTRVMAHLFTQAPHHYSAVAALRWAQVCGLGGSKGLARAVVGTRLGKVLENEEFWESVLHFFVNHPGLDLAQVGPVVDFLQHQRFEWKDGVSPGGVFGKQPPPRPDYTMKGRTVASILRQVEEWHKQLGQETNQPSIAWRHAPFHDFRLVRGEEAGEYAGVDNHGDPDEPGIVP